jgi:putative oxidoreductase
MFKTVSRTLLMMKNDSWRLVAARALIALLFVGAGADKMLHGRQTMAYMESGGIPGALLPAVIVLEFGVGLAFLFGWRTQFAAWVLAAFTLAAGAIFHHAFNDPVQLAMFMKNLAIAGGLLAFTTQRPPRNSPGAI